METRSVHETDDEVQALALQEALESEGIAAVLINHRDTAYPGITDRQRHGTEIRVEADQVAKATELIEEFLAAQPVEGPPIAPPPDPRGYEDQILLGSIAIPKLGVWTAGLRGLWTDEPIPSNDLTEVRWAE